MITVALMGRKGGVTKTTLAINIAAACARAGYRTVLVDADGQGCAADMMGITPFDGLYDLLINDAEFKDVLRPVPVTFHGQGELFVLPTWTNHRRLENNPQTIPAMVENFAVLKDWAEVVIIDTSPAITDIHTAVYYVADYAILPTTLDYPAVRSMAQMFSYLEAAKRAGRDKGYASAQVLGIVPNRFEANHGTQRENLGYIKGKYEGKRIFEPIRNKAVWGQAVMALQSIYTYAADDPQALRVAQREFEPVALAVLAQADEDRQVQVANS